MTPVINLANLALNSWKRGERYQGSDVSFGRQLGLTGSASATTRFPPARAAARSTTIMARTSYSSS